jgi:hypothetical protein
MLRLSWMIRVLMVFFVFSVGAPCGDLGVV